MQTHRWPDAVTVRTGPYRPLGKFRTLFKGTIVGISGGGYVYGVVTAR
jgi:hypothetical protein